HDRRQVGRHRPCPLIGVSRRHGGLLARIRSSRLGAWHWRLRSQDVPSASGMRRHTLLELSTPTMFGGYRKWFACPDCRRPARILYGVNSLQCRRCRGLKYASQSEASHWRAQRKALGIRRRLGASDDALDGPFPPKPPKMRWATYERLRAGDAALREQRLLGTAGGLRRFHSR